MNELSKVERDRLANEAAIRDQIEAKIGDVQRPCGQCCNPTPGTLIEGICADCQRENQLSIFDQSKRDPYDAAHGLD